MKKNVRLRALSWLVACALLFPGLLISCSADKPSDSPSLSDTPVTAYTLVRGDSSGGAVLRRVVELKEAIESKFGSIPASTTDWASDPAGSSDASAHELLIGVTNRSESLAANAELEGKFAYIIRSAGPHIVITASTVRLLSLAVTRFINDYLNKSVNGFLPSNIDVFEDCPAPCFLMDGQERTLQIAYPENSSSMLKSALRNFTSLLEENGVCAALSQEHCAAGTLLVGYTGNLPASEPNGTPANEGHIYYGGSCIVVEGASELMLASSLSALYEFLCENADEDLNGGPVLYCPKNLFLKEGWNASTPRLLGGKYLHTESISSNGARVFYENVSKECFELHVALLTGAMQYILAGTDGRSTFMFTENSGQCSLTIDYHEESGELELTEVHP